MKAMYSRDALYGAHSEQYRMFSFGILLSFHRIDV